MRESVATAGPARGARESFARHRALALAIVGAIVPPGLVTLLVFADGSASVTRMLYIAAIAAAAAIGGTASGVLAAVLSFAGLAYFFTPPVHSLELQHGSDAVALAVFVVVGLAVGQLVARERHARRRAEEAAADTRRLEAVARALARSRLPQQVLDAVLSEGLEAAEARAGLIAVLADDGETVEVIAHRGYDSVRFDEWGRFRVDEELPLSDAIRSGQPVFLRSTAERDKRYPLLAGLTERSHALACLPLVFEGRMLGGLVLSFPHDQEFDAGRRALKEALAAQVAQALDRARLDEAEREQRERLAFLAQASELLASSLEYERTLREFAELCVPRVADWCTIDLVSAEGGLERLAATDEAPPPFPGVLQSGEPDLAPDGTRITVSMVARNRKLGVLSLISADSRRRYTEADVELALELARRAAVAVDNARLHREVERRADAARALDHVAEAVVLVDEAGKPRFWNRAANRFLGDDAPPAYWAELQSLLHEDRWQTGATLTLPLVLDGRERWLEVSRVTFDEGCVFAVRDVTEERLLERTRSEFVATASHELRTPISAVYGVFHTLLRRDLDIAPEQEEQLLRLGVRESDRLRQIVEDLLLAGQLDGGRPDITTSRCDVGALAAEVVESTAARQNGMHAIEVAVPDDLGAIECDPRRLRQVLNNLIENAIKYSPAGGKVVVSAARSDGSVRIEVADQGIGIADADQERIFDRFVRLDPALTRGVGGTGLGLYICRELVERMNGRISVRSREGEGSTFVVELPATP